MQAYVVHSTLESNLTPDDEQRIKFVLTGSDAASNIRLESPWFSNQYNNNKWSLAVRLKHSSYPMANLTGSLEDDYLLEFYGVEADGDTERNSFTTSSTGVARLFFLLR